MFCGALSLQPDSAAGQVREVSQPGQRSKTSKRYTANVDITQHLHSKQKGKAGGKVGIKRSDIIR